MSQIRESQTIVVFLWASLQNRPHNTATKRRFNRDPLCVVSLSFVEQILIGDVPLVDPSLWVNTGIHQVDSSVRTNI